MRYCMFAWAAIWALACAGCNSFPGGWPSCSGWQLETGPVDTDGDGAPDGFGVRGVKRFLTACTVPGEDVGVVLTTEVSGGVRSYRLNVVEGPGTGDSFKIADVYDAISAMDQVFKGGGYDMSYQVTSDYRDSVKAWLINNWMSANDYHAITGF